MLLIPQLIASGMFLLRVFLTVQSISIRELDLASDLPEVKVDRSRIQQVVINLLSNAIQAMPKGGELAIRTFVDGFELDAVEDRTNSLQMEHSGETAVVQIEDTGSGFDTALLSKVFDPFVTTNRQTGGTGLGLAISSRLVDVMGGTMWVESEPGEGSTFFFTITTAEAPVQADEPTLYLSANHPELRNKRALIVDDNKTNLHILSLHCQRWGMIPRTTDSPKKALEWVKKGDPFDVGIFDLHMPDISGTQLAAKLRSHRSAAVFPLILLSSSLQVKDSNPSLFQAVAVKPIQQKQLFEMIMNVFGTTQPSTTTMTAQSHIDRTLSEQIPLHILIAEDNIVNQKLLARILKQMGYMADVVSNGAEAIEAVEKNSYDMVFMDVHMPKMDGFEAARQIVNKWDSTKRPKIVAVTADAMEGDREKALQAGMDDYLSKPVRMEQIQAIIERWGQPASFTKGDRPAVSGEQFDDSIDERLQQLEKETDGDFVVEIVDSYLEQSKINIGKLRESLDAKDTEQATYYAHSMRGASLNVGAKKLAERCQFIEESLETDSTVDLSPALSETEDLYRKTAAQLSSLQQKLKT